MSVLYKNSLKKQMCIDICLNGHSTIKTAQKYNVPLKTLENWITAFNKDNHCFDSDDVSDFHLVNPIYDDSYDDLNIDELKHLLLKRDIEVARLKKGYLVKEGGMGEKVFITFSKKNMK